MDDVKHVLLVDDEEEIVNFMERFLKRFKIGSTKALSGEAAIQAYEKDKMDFVFLDVRMEGMSGLDVLKELKKKNPDVKVIMVTGSSSSQDEARQLGAIDYISKPIDLGELRDRIEKYMLA
jgi:DNA-binding response OmpR family regulator